MTIRRGAAVILAAGVSRRYGTDKRLVEIDDEPMLLRAITPFVANVSRVVVSIRPKDPIRSLLPTDIEYVEAKEAHLGMGHSLATAVSHLSTEPWLLVGLADMPWIQSATIARLVEAMQCTNKGIVRPVCAGTPGHPVGFTRDFFDELTSLTGDTGARELIWRYKNHITAVEVSDLGILKDIDTPDNLRS